MAVIAELVFPVSCPIAINRILAAAHSQPTTLTPCKDHYVYSYKQELIISYNVYTVPTALQYYQRVHDLCYAPIV